MVSRSYSYITAAKPVTKLGTGIWKMDSEVQNFYSGTKSSDHYFMISPQYEVSSERLKWLEQEIFIGQ
jgi:hypothetical protein